MAVRHVQFLLSAPDQIPPTLSHLLRHGISHRRSRPIRHDWPPQGPLASLRMTLRSRRRAGRTEEDQRDKARCKRLGEEFHGSRSDFELYPFFLEPWLFV